MNGPTAADEVNPHAVMLPGGAWGVLIAVTSDRKLGIVARAGRTVVEGYSLGDLTFYVPKTQQRDRPEVNDSRRYAVKRRKGG
jgi:hypothetical protein